MLYFVSFDAVALAVEKVALLLFLELAFLALLNVFDMSADMPEGVPAFAPFSRSVSV
ncbi:MAG: hypothetical protein K8F91_10955 [Candidatus Obscuribacterales bacterium]|nr:hypothetical protein [Candidatus Obscuribacterales bacterium]